MACQPPRYRPGMAAAAVVVRVLLACWLLLDHVHAGNVTPVTITRTFHEATTTSSTSSADSESTAATLPTVPATISTTTATTTTTTSTASTTSTTPVTTTDPTPPTTRKTKRVQHPPNIVIIVADDLGWNDVGFHGSNQIPTPNLDALAYTGIPLANYHVMPVCTPSRSALMTGRHPVNIGMQHGVINGGEPWGLPLTEKLLPEYLQELGYRTHAVGKWHLGHWKRSYLPTSRGFHSHYGYWLGQQDYYDHTSKEKFWGYSMRRDLSTSWSSYGRYSTDLFSDEAVRIVKAHDRNSMGPLFLYLAHLAVHSANPYTPLQAPPETVSKFSSIQDENRRIYAAMVSKLDESVGLVTAALDEAGLLNNTLIIFTTDNGGPAQGFNMNAASNWPLRGVKGTLFEGGTRGAGFIWGAGLPINHKGTFRGLMHIQDWLPTLLSATGATPPPGLDGHNLWPFLSKPQDEKDTTTTSDTTYEELLINSDTILNISAIIWRNWKLINGKTYEGQWDGWYGPSGQPPEYPAYDIASVRASAAAAAIAHAGRPLPEDDRLLYETREQSQLHCANAVNEEAEQDPKLFNLADDPCEKQNLASRHPDLVAQLTKKILQYESRAMSPRNKPLDPASDPKFWKYTWTNWGDYPRPPGLIENSTPFTSPAAL